MASAFKDLPCRVPDSFSLLPYSHNVTKSKVRTRVCPSEASRAAGEDC